MGRRTLVVGDGSIELAFRSVSGDLRIRDAAGRPVAPVAPDAPAPPVAPEPPTPFSDHGFDGLDFELPDIRIPDIHIPAFDLPDLSAILGGRGHGPKPVPATGDEPARPAVDDPDATDAAAAAESTDATAAAPTHEADTTETERLSILRALERGDLDVATAMDRLAALDAAEEAADA